jgi:hypothetical protein
VTSRIPIAYRLRLLFFFWRRAIGYALFVSIIAVIGVVVFERLVRVSPLEGEIYTGNLVKLVGWLLLLMLATVGYWIGALMYTLFHRSETPLFLNGGWSIAALSLVGWVVTILASGALASVIYFAGG